MPADRGRLRGVVHGMDTTYPLGWCSGHTIEQLLEMRERCTLRFMHGPHEYEVPSVDSTDPVAAKACRDFLFAIFWSFPSLIQDLTKEPDGSLP